MKKVNWFVFGALLLLASQSYAQINTALKKRFYNYVTDTLVLDSLSLVPGSIRLSGKRVPAYEIDYAKHAIIFKKDSITADSISITYKTFPYNFENNYFHKDPQIVGKDLSRPKNPYTISFNEPPNNNNLFLNDGLNKNGSISRGITFGNNQDMVVNSNLNLQVSGKLTPEIDMVLAATDNNIPFQADGTTAQLQEFDKVYIQLSNYNTKLIVGDYQLSKPQNSYFMNFYKRAQGAYISNSYTDSMGKKPVTFKTQLSGAVSKGKFARNIIFGTENNQGPYRLTGANSEPFVIVLSGTEKIYIDGKLLQRGQENDYIIDYNTAEVTFTAKQIITKDKRIVAEFQYAERNYGRSLFFVSEEIESGKLKVFADLYSEQDNKNRSLQQTLTQDQKEVMYNIGDTLTKAYYSGAETAVFNNSEVFYKKHDTIVNSILYTGVYVYSTNPDSAKYRVKFTNLGAGKGNYIQVSSSANGKVYKWIAPVAGVLQGNYEPIVPLVTPKQNQMITGGFDYKFNESHALVMEGVFTKNDINTFSPFDAYNDQGYGYKLKSINKTSLLKDTVGKSPLSLLYNVNYEYVQKDFTQIERFRSIEFQRDWNRPYVDAINTDQHITSAEVGVEKSNRYRLVYGFNSFNEGNYFNGYKQQVNGRYTYKKFISEYNGSFLSTNNKPYNTEFYRHKSLLSQGIGKKIRVSLSDEFENNLFKASFTNTILPRTYQFWEWEASITNTDSTTNKIKLFYRERRDKQAYNQEIKDSTYAQNIGAQIGLYSLKNHPITLYFTYRELHLKNVVSNTLKPDNSMLSRLEYSPRLIKGFITSTLFYETGYGLENKKEFYYIEVSPGQGQYAWNDYNGNGVKELNEFETALYSDQAKYIRVYTPTNQYVKVLQNQLSFAFNLRPNVLLREAKGFGSFIGRFATQTVYRIDNKTYDRGQFFNTDFFTSSVNDTALLATNYSLRQSVFFNQSATVFGMDYTYLNNKNKQLLLNGFDSRDNGSHELRWRLNFLKSWSVLSNNITGVKSYASQFFTNRNYRIEYYDLEQKLSYQPNTAFRVSAIYKFTNKQNIGEGGFQKADINDYAIELRYNQSDKGSFNLRGDFLTITYNDIESSSIAYEMLNALRPGYNYTWTISYQRNLTGNIQISINYDGRKTPNANVVHIGGAQVRAFF